MLKSGSPGECSAVFRFDDYLMRESATGVAHDTADIAQELASEVLLLELRVLYLENEERALQLPLTRGGS